MPTTIDLASLKSLIRTHKFDFAAVASSLNSSHSLSLTGDEVRKSFAKKEGIVVSDTKDPPPVSDATPKPAAPSPGSWDYEKWENEQSKRENEHTARTDAAFTKVLTALGGSGGVVDVNTLPGDVRNAVILKRESDKKAREEKERRKREREEEVRRPADAKTGGY